MIKVCLTLACEFSLMVGFTTEALAECPNCQSGHGGAVVGNFGPGYVPAMSFGAGPMMMAGPAMAAAASATIPPPPGTLGRTYRLHSRAVPREDHPRSARVVVRGAIEDEFYSVSGDAGELDATLEPDSNLWTFETDEEALIPGVPHIYRVEARHDEKDEDPYAVRWVRLIPGRIVYLDF